MTRRSRSLLIGLLLVSASAARAQYRPVIDAYFTAGGASRLGRLLRPRLDCLGDLRLGDLGLGDFWLGGLGFVAHLSVPRNRLSRPDRDPLHRPVLVGAAADPGGRPALGIHQHHLRVVQRRLAGDDGRVPDHRDHGGDEGCREDLVPQALELDLEIGDRHLDDVVLLRLADGPSPLAPEQIVRLGKAQTSEGNPFPGNRQVRTGLRKGFQ